MALEAKGSANRWWLLIGSPDGDIAPQVIATSAIERYWFSVEGDQTIIVLRGRENWLHFDGTDLTHQIDRALGIDWAAVRDSDEEDSEHA